MSEAKRSALRIVVTGRVQGVSFRYFTRRVAQGIGVGGTVRNLADGSVEVIAAGTPDELERLKEALRSGPPAASVTGLAEEELSDVPEWGRFEIVY